MAIDLIRLLEDNQSAHSLRAIVPDDNVDLTQYQMRALWVGGGVYLRTL